MMQELILVDENDRQIGQMEKMAAHKSGALHRAFSVFIFNDKNQLLLQKRALSKYHCGGLWSNTCCSHPVLGQENNVAATNRLVEEMGIFCALTPKFVFKYYASFENGLIEHEIDHVFFGYSNDVPVINEAEVADYKYVSLEELNADMMENPALYTPWLKICLPEIMAFQNGVK